MTTACPQIFLGHIISKWFTSNYLFGFPKLLSLGGFVRFQPGILKVHPTQIYESVIGFLIFLYLYKIRLTNKVAGSLFFKYLMFAGIERFFIEFIRMNPKYLFNLSGAQLISLGMISISIWFFYFKKKESPVS